MSVLGCSNEELPSGTVRCSEPDDIYRFINFCRKISHGVTSGPVPTEPLMELNVVQLVGARGTPDEMIRIGVCRELEHAAALWQ